MSQHNVVLYDQPGPRTRLITTVVSVVVGLLLVLVAYRFVYQPLADEGQFSMERWGPLIDPGNEYFPQVWRRLGEGLRATLLAAVFAIVFSLLFGTALGVLRVLLGQLRPRRFPVASASLARLVRPRRGGAKGPQAAGGASTAADGSGAAPAAAASAAAARPGLENAVSLVLRAPAWLLHVLVRIFVELFRGAPVVITIFFVWRVLPEFGLRPPDLTVGGVLPLPSLMWSLVIGLTLYNGVVIAEIVRSGMQGLPLGQTEAAYAIGLTQPQTVRLILLPQAFRVMLPALISQLVVVLKDTALGFIITYSEVMRIANLLAENPRLRNPLQMYLVVGTLFIIVNYTLSRLAIYTERRLARGRRAKRSRWSRLRFRRGDRPVTPATPPPRESLASQAGPAAGAPDRTPAPDR